MNLLQDSLFSLKDGNPMSLPGVLARLSRGELTEYAQLRPLAEQAWHSFLVQLAACALDRAQEEAPWIDDDRWREALIELGGGEAAWSFVNEDLSQPAFMQPPVPEGKLSVLKDGPLSSPDDTALDILYTGRSHDLKPSCIREPSPEDWVYALITLQTLSAFGGRSNYGVARMNGAYSSRPMIAISGPWHERFARDVRAWQRTFGQRPELYDRAAGACLLWTLPWEGKKSLRTQELHPGFIEVCRRVRLARVGEALVAYRVGTDAPRIDAKALNGVTGDAWTPVNREKVTSLSVKGGFSYKLVSSLLFSGEWALPESLDGMKESVAVEFRVLEGGQGETAGFHRRTVPVPKKASGIFRGDTDARQKFSERAKAQIELIQKVASSALRPAIAAMLQGAPEKLDLSDDQIKPCMALYETRVDAQFFEQLFRNPEAFAEDHIQWFSEFLDAAANETFEKAKASLPIPNARRERAISTADSLFHSGLRKQLPAVYPPKERELNAT